MLEVINYKVTSVRYATWLRNACRNYLYNTVSTLRSYVRMYTAETSNDVVLGSELDVTKRPSCDQDETVVLRRGPYESGRADVTDLRVSIAGLDKDVW
jgi:hypothetical protein